MGVSSRKFFFLSSFIFCFLPGAFTPVVRATFYGYDLTVFTANGSPYDELAVSFHVTDTTDKQVNRAAFTFYNDSAVISSITEIYFDSGTFLGISSIITSGPEVLFIAEFVSPPVLPGWNTIGFNMAAGLLIGSDNPGPKNGVKSLQNPEEWVTIVFDLKCNSTFDDVIADLDSRDINIGVHLTNIGTGDYSESFTYHLPEPATFCLIAVGAFAFLKKHRT